MKTESAIIIKVWEILAAMGAIAGFGWIVNAVVNFDGGDFPIVLYAWRIAICFGSALICYTVALGLRLLRNHVETIIDRPA